MRSNRNYCCKFRATGYIVRLKVGLFVDLMGKIQYEVLAGT
jgi:hypothetical protein